MASLDRRLRAMERRAFPDHADCIWTDAEQIDAYVERLHRRGYPAADQIDDLIDTLRIRRAGGNTTKYPATDRELYILEALIDAEVVGAWARDYFDRMPAAEQPEREAELFGLKDWSRANRAAHREWDASEQEHGSRYPMPDHIADKFRALDSTGRRREGRS